MTRSQKWMLALALVAGVAFGSVMDPWPSDAPDVEDCYHWSQPCAEDPNQ